MLEAVGYAAVVNLTGRSGAKPQRGTSSVLTFTRRCRSATGCRRHLAAIATTAAIGISALAAGAATYLRCSA